METTQASAGLPAFAAPSIPTAGSSDQSQRSMVTRSRYLAVLEAMFTLFSSARVMAYLPTIWAVVTTGDSGQHSLWTWLTFLGGNVTMAVWLWENNARRCNAAVAASGSNALMCLAIVAVIAWTRL